MRRRDARLGGSQAELTSADSGIGAPSASLVEEAIAEERSADLADEAADDGVDAVEAEPPTAAPTAPASEPERVRSAEPTTTVPPAAEPHASPKNRAPSCESVLSRVVAEAVRTAPGAEARRVPSRTKMFGGRISVRHHARGSDLGERSTLGERSLLGDVAGKAAAAKRAPRVMLTAR
jgi:hypothetical protein